MTFHRDDRGVSPLIGFIFVFGFLILLLSIWQSQVVPAENAGVEVSHYLDVRNDMTELRSALIDAGATSDTRSTTVRLGTAYPTRVLFVSAPPSTGTVHTERIGNGTINATGFDPGSVCGTGGEFTTRSVRYDPQYRYHEDREMPPYAVDTRCCIRTSTTAIPSPSATSR